MFDIKILAKEQKGYADTIDIHVSSKELAGRAKVLRQAYDLAGILTLSYFGMLLIPS